MLKPQISQKLKYKTSFFKIISILMGNWAILLFKFFLYNTLGRSPDI
jgi:hypothetical protein